MPARFRRRAQTEGDTYCDLGSESEAWSLRGVTGTCLKHYVVTGQAVAPSRHEFWALQAPLIEPKYWHATNAVRGEHRLAGSRPDSAASVNVIAIQAAV